MLDVNHLTVAELIALVRQDHKDNEQRNADIAKIENQIFALNSDIYAITRRGQDYRDNGSRYLNALNEAIVGDTNAS